MKSILTAIQAGIAATLGISLLSLGQPMSSGGNY